LHGATRTWTKSKTRNGADNSAAADLTRNLPRLFVEFQQLDATMAKKYGETGLGSALTKSVEAQGGWVGVRSIHGLGSIFFAVLPRVCHSNSQIRKKTGPAGAWPAGATSRAL
jgi:hypothetical protein